MGKAVRRSALALSLLMLAACSGKHHNEPNGGSAGKDGGPSDDGGGVNGSSGSHGGSGNGQGGASSDDGGVAGDGGASGDGGPAAGDPGFDAAVLPPPADCGRYGDACSASGTCCSGICDPASNTCASA